MDRARKVRKILPVSPCDIRGLEAWLEEQANAGLFPVSIGSWAVFTTDGVPGTRFRLEPYDRGRTAPTEEQRELYIFGVCAACSAKEEDAQNPSA